MERNIYTNFSKYVFKLLSCLGNKDIFTICDGHGEKSEALGQHGKMRPLANEASRKFSGGKRTGQVQLFCTVGVNWIPACFSRLTMHLHLQ